MSRSDVILIHAPSVFDFRKRTVFYGPISDVIPSSPIFEMYPIGFVTLASFLRRHGYRVRIVNLALKMMRSKRFDVEKYLSELDAAVFGIDLHWLPHAHGSIEVARLLKRFHPTTPVLFGGISASYYHEELIREEAVDFVIRGSVAEPALLALVQELEGPQQYQRVPNLTWKKGGGTQINAMQNHFASLDPYEYDLGMMVWDVITRLDFWTNVPFNSWWNHPITAVLTVRGCERGCVTCGASRPAFARFMSLSRPLRRSPAAIAEQVRELARLTRAPIFLVGDIGDGGSDYANGVVDALAETGVSNRIVFEFFQPPDAKLLERIDGSIRHWGAELSPESHDDTVRHLMGKSGVSTKRIHECIAQMLTLRCENLDLFYMIGLPGQTKESVRGTLDEIEHLFTCFDKRLSAFITPMGPFIDPGSEGFEHAEAHGYHLYAHSLEDHRRLLEKRDWESILNYETKWMTRAEIVDATYDAAERLNELKLSFGRISVKTAASVRRRVSAARALRLRLASAGEGDLDPETYRQLIGEIRAFSEGTVNDKAELFAPAAFVRNFRLLGIARLFVKELFRRTLAALPGHQSTVPAPTGASHSA